MSVTNCLFYPEILELDGDAVDNSKAVLPHFEMGAPIRGMIRVTVANALIKKVTLSVSLVAHCKVVWKDDANSPHLAENRSVDVAPVTVYEGPIFKGDHGFPIHIDLPDHCTRATMLPTAPDKSRIQASLTHYLVLKASWAGIVGENVKINERPVIIRESTLSRCKMLSSISSLYLSNVWGEIAAGGGSKSRRKPAFEDSDLMYEISADRRTMLVGGGDQLVLDIAARHRGRGRQKKTITCVGVSLRAITEIKVPTGLKRLAPSDKRMIDYLWTQMIPWDKMPRRAPSKTASVHENGEGTSESAEPLETASKGDIELDTSRTASSVAEARHSVNGDGNSANVSSNSLAHFDEPADPYTQEEDHGFELPVNSDAPSELSRKVYVPIPASARPTHISNPLATHRHIVSIAFFLDGADSKPDGRPATIVECPIFIVALGIPNKKDAMPLIPRIPLLVTNSNAAKGINAPGLAPPVTMTIIQSAGAISPSTRGMLPTPKTPLAASSHSMPVSPMMGPSGVFQPRSIEVAVDAISQLRDGPAVMTVSPAETRVDGLAISEVGADRTSLSSSNGASKHETYEERKSVGDATAPGEGATGGDNNVFKEVVADDLTISQLKLEDMKEPPSIIKAPISSNFVETDDEDAGEEVNGRSSGISEERPNGKSSAARDAAEEDDEELLVDPLLEMKEIPPGRFFVVFLYQASSPVEMSLNAGDIVTIKSVSENGWAYGTNETTGVSGQCPFHFLCRERSRDLDSNISHSLGQKTGDIIVSSMSNQIEPTSDWRSLCQHELRFKIRSDMLNNKTPDVGTINLPQPAHVGRSYKRTLSSWKDAECPICAAQQKS